MAEIKFSKIKRLINSSNKEDILIGISLFYNKYEKNSATLKRLASRYFDTVNFDGYLDIYIGDYNFWLFGYSISVYDQRVEITEPWESGEEIRL